MITGREEGAMRMGRRTIDADRAMVMGIVTAVGGGRGVLEQPDSRQGYSYNHANRSMYAL